MKIIFFTHKNSGVYGLKLYKAVMNQVRNDGIDVVFSVDELKWKFKEIGYRISIDAMVLIAESKERLESLYRMVDLFEGKQILLILPDNDPDTISKGHRFRPRFLTVIGTSIEDITNVLNKMVRTSRSKSLPLQTLCKGASELVARAVPCIG